MALNVKLLKKVIRHIEANPKRFDMKEWAEPNGNKTPCGTTACIAGWTIILADENPKRFYAAAKSDAKQGIEIHDYHSQLNPLFFGGPGLYIHPGETASHLLGLGPMDRERLFHADHWPEPFRSSHAAAGPRARKTKVKIAVARLKHFMETGK